MNVCPLKNAVGIISTRQAVTQVLDELRVLDFPMEKISVFTLDSEREKLPDDRANQQIITPIAGAKAGAITGGTSAGFLALTAGLFILVIPGVGPVLAVESVLVTLLAGGASAILGSVYGAFQGWFTPERQVKLCNPTSQAEFLVKVEATDDEIQQAESILRYWGVREWQVYESSQKFS
ncbi:hypothetical protein [Calothrix sp. NIES-2098]|uniref:hypothetical protein n=1 Tax=Calothrix sp. NIES-2098 TaxID=1954171 RepID=UPI000B5DC889|nr:hypothetical protein NIES2098_24000 [Calothrix sp. NIES-2098]